MKSNIMYIILLTFVVNNPLFSFRDSTTSADDEYINPNSWILTIKIKPEGNGYPFAERTNPDFGFLYDVNVYYDFCSTIKKRFEHSNMTNTEAENLFSILNQYEYHEEQWGFPSPDNEPSKYDVRKRIMIRKISESTYEIFYHLIGCGADIKYLKITISNGLISTVIPLEEWRIHNPC